MGIVTAKKLEDADKDADSLNTFINGSDTAKVKTRTNKEYPTLANAVRQVMETGGFEPFATETALLASRPTITKKAAKALDTKKVWLWDGSKWNDTGLSELELAKSYVDRLADSKDESLDIFQVEDSVGQITLKQTPDAHLHIPHITGSVQDNINTLKKSISDSDLGSFAEIHDDNGNIVAEFTNDFDLKIGQVPEGIGAKLNSEQLTSKTSEVKHSNYFLIREDAALVVASMSALNPVLRAPVPLNQVPLNYSIPSLIINLQIEQPEMSKLNTTYRTDDGVVHPNIIEFYEKFNGSKYWLGITGYLLNQDKFENPFLFKTDDLKNFEMFDDYPQPLVERPQQQFSGDDQYNSDIFLFYDFYSSELCMGYRTTRKLGSASSRNSISYRSTKDGKNWSEIKTIIPETSGSDNFLSPSIIYDFISKKYLLYVVDIENGRYELIRWELNYIGGVLKNRTVIATPRSFTPWHCDIRYIGNKIFAVIQDNYDTQNMYLGMSSDNGNSFEFGNPILTGEFHKPYKATCIPIIDEDNDKAAINFIWTSRNLPENINERWRLYSQKTNFINLDSE